MSRRDPNSWTVVRLPERELADVLLDLPGPLLERLGPNVPLEQVRDVLALVVEFWNAGVRASKRWDRPRMKELKELQKRLRGKQASRGDAALFDMLTERQRSHWLDPRLVESWSYDVDAAGARKLTCVVGLPDGVRAEVSPPADQRISIAGAWLDEVSIRTGANSYLSFPHARHSGVTAEDGTATVHAMMPAALQLLASGRLPRVGGPPVHVVIGGRKLGLMVLHEVRAGGERHDLATLVFKPAGGGEHLRRDHASLEAVRKELGPIEELLEGGKPG